MDEKKVQYGKNEVKNRAVKKVVNCKKKKIHQFISKSPMAIYNNIDFKNARGGESKLVTDLCKLEPPCVAELDR